MAPMIRAARPIPSSTRCGASSRICRSLNVPGSLSSALQTTYLGAPTASRTICHLAPVGKPAPPMPRSPAVFSAAITASAAVVALQAAQGGVALAARVGVNLLQGRD